ncbi:glycosyltransferase family 2 protein [Filimonas lacunae]|uniref:glycosyltransferase family 2 protein n=1 Tax=Filimonas lacunae TaxID=477680 RepID=UPI0007D73851|nr:glycosyltransferase family 2 protein [Filimonas lacunae]BAV04415.1 glycosyltransferase [Filimonas lacunae]
MNPPEVAIVILNYNGRNYLEKFLPSVLASTYTNKRVIVADNASLDDSVAFVKANFPQVELILNTSNYGFAGGYNKALEQVKSDYYVLLNSDVEVTPNWIEPVITLMQQDSAIKVCQPKLLDYHRKDYFEYAGASGGWLDFLGYPLARGRVFETLEKDKQQYNDPIPIFWASGAAMFIEADVYHAAGGLDEYFFAHQEEIDLCWRVQLAGHKLYCCPASVVYHVGGGTLPKGHRKTYLNFRNNIIMLLKNLPASEKIWKIPFRILLDWAFAFKCILSGDTNSVKAIFKAHYDVIAWTKTEKAFRPVAIKPMRQLAGVVERSIVWAYFLKGRKIFTEIVQ